MSKINSETIDQLFGFIYQRYEEFMNEPDCHEYLEDSKTLFARAWIQGMIDTLEAEKSTTTKKSFLHIGKIRDWLKSFFNKTKIESNHFIKSSLVEF